MWCMRFFFLAASTIKLHIHKSSSKQVKRYLAHHTVQKFDNSFFYEFLSSLLQIKVQNLESGFQTLTQLETSISIE